MVIKNGRESVLGYSDEYEDNFDPPQRPLMKGGNKSPSCKNRQSKLSAEIETALTDDTHRLPDRPRLERGDQLVPRRWRQWYARSLEVKATPLEIEEPRRRRWGRMVYLIIVIGGLLIGLNFLAGHTFWYNAQGVIGGQIYPLSPANVSVVKQIEVQPGDHVSKGQELISFSSPQLNREVAQTQVNLADAQSNLQDKMSAEQTTTAALQAEISGLQSQYDALQQQYDIRQQQIDSIRRLAAKGTLNFGDAMQLQQQQLQTKAQYSQVHAKIQSDRAQLKVLKAASKHPAQMALDGRMGTLDRFRQSLHSEVDALNLRSPIDGVIAQIPVADGQTVKPGETAVIVAPSDNQRTLLYFPPAARANLSKGDVVPVTTPDGSTVRMRISNIYPSVQDIPEDLQGRVDDQDNKKIVAVAQPFNPQDISMLQAGTPVTARVARWKASAWFSQLGHTIGGWLEQG